MYASCTFLLLFFFIFFLFVTFVSLSLSASVSLGSIQRRIPKSLYKLLTCNLSFRWCNFNWNHYFVLFYGICSVYGCHYVALQRLLPFCRSHPKLETKYIDTQNGWTMAVRWIVRFFKQYRKKIIFIACHSFPLSSTRSFCLSWKNQRLHEKSHSLIITDKKNWNSIKQ